jgi:hypothetical protein
MVRASLKDPGPVSILLLTVKVAPKQGSAASEIKNPGNRERIFNPIQEAGFLF